ncbi:hypothetical protein BDV95DRAFT_634246 [Massariosphaeria phaeospora]|uniref:Uncharacterized protein n=1 Tax=Massariosphaeria phaeospora TaxID=100035 RepID=A0A7C8IRJ9_9PLEO|nr:hypothetical protein BDV95DRAFT_634246 [Massariosphaeria phaeospora]
MKGGRCLLLVRQFCSGGGAGARPERVNAMVGAEACRDGGNGWQKAGFDTKHDAILAGSTGCGDMVGRCRHGVDRGATEWLRSAVSYYLRTSLHPTRSSQFPYPTVPLRQHHSFAHQYLLIQLVNPILGLS